MIAAASADFVLDMPANCSDLETKS